jgi:hypothetical protein
MHKFKAPALIAVLLCVSAHVASAQVSQDEPLRTPIDEAAFLHAFQNNEEIADREIPSTAIMRALKWSQDAARAGHALLRQLTVRRSRVVGRVAASVLDKTAVGDLPEPTRTRYRRFPLDGVCVIPVPISIVRTTFDQAVDLSGCLFQALVNFQSSRFNDDLRFATATFQSGATFDSVAFRAGARFSEVEFAEEATFIDAEFHGYASFAEAVFKGRALFDSQVLDTLNFNRARFLDDVSMELNRARSAGGKIDVSKAVFAKTASFTGLQCVEGSFFDTEFHGRVNFQYATFTRHVTFLSATFRDDVHFVAARFPEALPEQSRANRTGVELDRVQFHSSIDSIGISSSPRVHGGGHGKRAT